MINHTLTEVKVNKSKKISPALFFILFTLVLCAFCVILTYMDKESESYADTDTSEDAPSLRAVIIDAGHGGEDGGASSSDGVKEKDINLEIALMLRDLYTSVGIPTVLTRAEDVLLYDKSSDHVGKKKVMDLSNRLSIAQSTPDSLFISIHQNAFSDKQYSGLQVWYSSHSPLSKEIASDIQDSVKQIQASNYRKTKAADSRLFILDHLTTPAVLVECGFLSNDGEATKLNTEEYQKKLAFIIFISTVKYFQNP